MDNPFAPLLTQSTSNAGQTTTAPSSDTSSDNPFAPLLSGNKQPTQQTTTTSTPQAPRPESTGSKIKDFLFPTATQTASELGSDPLTLKADPHKALGDIWDSIKGSVENEAQNIQDLFNPEKTSTIGGKFAAPIKLITGAAGIAFSPLTALFKGAEDIPVLGSVSKLLTLPFSVAGDAGKDLGMGFVEKLPISDAAKKQLTPAVGDLFSLAAQFYAGDLSTDLPGLKTVKDNLTKKYGPTEADTIVNKAQEMAQQKTEHTQAVAAEPTDKANLDKIAEQVKNQPEQPVAVEPKKTVSQITNELTDAGYAKGDISRIVSDLYRQNPNGDFNAKQVDEIKQDYLPKTKDVASVTSDLQKKGYTDEEINTIVKNLHQVKPEGDFLKSDVNTETQKLKGEDLYKMKTGVVAKTVETKGAEPISARPENAPIPKETQPTEIKGKFAQRTQELLKKTTGEGVDIPAADTRTWKEGTDKSFDIISKDIEKTKSILRGEEPLPSDIEKPIFINSVISYLQDNPDSELLKDLTNSPLQNLTEEARNLSSARILGNNDFYNNFKAANDAIKGNGTDFERQKIIKQANDLIDKQEVKAKLDKFLSDNMC